MPAPPHRAMVRRAADVTRSLAEALAPRIAEELAARLNVSPAASNGDGLGMARLVMLDELVSQLPATKELDTWRRWLYEHLRRGEVPGAVKLGGSWHFDVERVQAWLEAGAA